ncbi:hypothetical protein ACMFMG_003799 [Clarireedia jacksonii]
MAFTFDHLNTSGKKALIISLTTVGIILSHLTTILRVYAKKVSIGHLQKEDWVMCAALIATYPNMIMEFWGITVGVGSHQKTLTKADLRRVNLSVWIIQRFYPIAIFLVKTSIILFYVRLFGSSRKFRIVAWAVWIYTLLWAIGAWFATTFECTPVNYFWDKRVKGHCVNNLLSTIGVPNGVLAIVGDLFILCMPIPMILRLQMNRRRKIALIALMLCGLFVVCTSIVRLVAIASIDHHDLSFTQVQPGLWTYLEASLGITCGNLPLLRTLPKRFFDRRHRRSTASSQGSKKPLNNPNVPRTRSSGRKGPELDDITLGTKGPSGSDEFVNDKDEEQGIRVDTEVRTKVETR